MIRRSMALLLATCVVGCFDDDARSAESRDEFAASYAAEFCALIEMEKGCRGATTCYERRKRLERFNASECRLATAGEILSDLRESGVTEEGWREYRGQAVLCLEAFQTISCDDVVLRDFQGEDCYAVSQSKSSLLESTCDAFDW